MDSQTQRLSVTPISWMEAVEGSSSKANLAQAKVVLNKFDVVYLTSSDQHWAMERLEQFQFSHHIDMTDCLIASVAYRLQVPLYTHNLKDMTPMVDNLAVN